MQGTWQITVTRNGKPAFVDRKAMTRGPQIGDELDCLVPGTRETIKVKIVGASHHEPPHESGLGVWDVNAEEIA